nr:hypothetical protein [Crepidula fornicata]
MGAMHVLFLLLAIPALCSAYAGDGAQTATCDRLWEKVYEHDEQGTPMFGNKDDLKFAVLRGAIVRILLHNIKAESNSPETFSFTAGSDNINIRGSEICAEIINHISLTQCEFVSNAHYRLFLPCTTGNVHVAQYLVESPTFLGQDTQKVHISWFIKDTQADMYNNKPFYGHFLDGGNTVGRKEELLRAAKEGKELRAMMSDRGYVFPMQVLMWSHDGRISGQSNRHLSQKYSGNNIVYNIQTPYFWYSSWSTNGRRDSVRYAVGGQTNRGRGSDYVSLNWFVDPCWKHAYTNDEFGQPADGSINMLIAAVKSGQRIRVVLRNFAMEATYIRVKGGHVTAYLTDMLSVKGGKSFDEFDFETKTRFEFKLVHTTGTMRSYGFEVKNMSIPLPHIVSKETVKWFFETRTWHKIMETANNGEVTWGMRGNIKSAINKAANIRIGLTFNPRAGSMYFSADNARVPTNSEEARIQAVRILGDQPANEYEYKLSEHNFWVYMCVPLSSSINLSGWRMGKHQRFFQGSKAADIEWFADL